VRVFVAADEYGPALPPASQQPLVAIRLPDGRVIEGREPHIVIATREGATQYERGWTVNG